MKKALHTLALRRRTPIAVLILAGVALLGISERWAAEVGVPAYAIDEQTAIKVVDATVEIISEGNWKLFNPSSVASKPAR